MSDYLALLPLTGPLDTEGARRLARQACLDLHRVEWLRSYVANDGTRMLCWYRAPDAESVRRVLRQQGTPAAAVALVDADAADAVPLEAAFDHVVVELPVLEPADRPRARSILASAGHAIARTFTSRRDAAATLLIHGHDIAAVTAALASADLTPAAVWRCLELDPRPPKLFRSTASVKVPRSASPGAKAPRASVERDLFDAVIVGAGISGICMLERLVRMGLRVRTYESAADVGGVWYWNRYPGARVDSESYTYLYSFSEPLVREWQWQELFAPQSEIAHYLRHVVDRFDLRRHLRFETRVAAATFDESGRCWRIVTDTGERVAARHLIAAAGTLSAPQFPDYPGIEDFAGASHHTARWPAEGFDLTGQRVAVIGTGATGVQVIQTIADEVAALTVFQRTPTYCIPQRNRLLTDADRMRIQRDWADILAACQDSYGGFLHTFDPRSGLAVSAAAREAKFEALWQQPGFAFWFANFGDLMMNDEVNAHACEFVRRKIRERVRDPEVARRLLPDHPFGAKRVPLENGYFEVFNRDNVRLVDLRETPIERITPRGIRTTTEEHPVDVIVYATGFDAGTGALTRIDLRGADGQSLAEKWQQGPRTCLGLMVAGFPNFFMVNGPHNAAALCNAGRCIEPNVDWIARCLEYVRAQGGTRVVPTAEAEAEWTRHVEDVADATVLARMRNSWFFGANTPGKARRVAIYAAGARAYREQCEAVAKAGYPGIAMA